MWVKLKKKKNHTCRIFGIDILGMHHKGLGNLPNFVDNVEKLHIHHRILPQNILPINSKQNSVQKRSNSNSIRKNSKFGTLKRERDHLGEVLVRAKTSKSSRMREMALWRLRARVFTDSKFSCCCTASFSLSTTIACCGCCCCCCCCCCWGWGWGANWFAVTSPSMAAMVSEPEQKDDTKYPTSAPIYLYFALFSFNSWTSRFLSLFILNSKDSHFTPNLPPLFLFYYYLEMKLSEFKLWITHSHTHAPNHLS